MRLESLLNDIQEVLNNVKNLEMVAASLYFVVNNLPLGNYYIFDNQFKIILHIYI